MKKTFIFYVILYLLSGVFTLTSLYYNAQTIPLIKQTTNLNKANSKLKLENQHLYNQISSKKSLKNIQLKAKELNMRLPNHNYTKHVTYPKKQ